jgi:hypothetical protein
VTKVREEEKERPSKGGRKATLPFVKTLNRLGAAAGGEGAFAGLDDVERLSDAEVDRLLQVVEALRDQLDAVEEALTEDR